MAASQFAGTGVYELIGTGLVTASSASRVSLNGTFRFTQAANGQCVIDKAGVHVLGPLTKPVLMQLWQDLALVGLAH